ncbi:MAG: hypothetical protein HDR19_07850 [Lachnospiraceae bacterium]|nr:hypothetical protein [Lachnospiraceae bacterium]
MEQKEFLKMIEACRRRMNLAGFLKMLLFALCVGAGVGILFQIAAFILPIYYVNLYTVLALLLALPAAGIAAFVKRFHMEQAALAMDRFGFDERIVTAYENLEREGALITLQREDAMRELRTNRDRIRIPLLPPFKKMLPLLGMLVLVSALAFIPSVTKERASELHSVKEEAKEKTKELEELVETLEELAQDEQLMPEQQAQIQEMIESLEASLSEYQQAVSSEMLAAASQKLDYKYQNMSNQMSGLAQSLQNGATVSVATVEGMQAMAEQLQKMSGQQLAQGSNGSGSQGQNGQNGQGQNGQNGQNGQGQNGQGNGQGQDGQGGQNGQGGNGQDGQGNGQGQDGQGSGNSGDGDGSGNGRGTGSSNTEHDYVSIPNTIADSGNLTGNAGTHDDSDFFRAQNGLSWEGTHISHEAVIGSYEQNAYEGIAAGKYPSGMEEIIKEYFASFN